MYNRKNNHESHLLTLSALFTSGFAATGLILGWLANSLVIMFDGIYSLISLLLTLLSLVVSYSIHHPKTPVSATNRAILEPLVIAIKAIAILLIVAYSLYESTMTLLHGGRPVDTSVATLFGLINVIGCGYVWWILKSRSQPGTFGLIDAEIKQWKMDTYLSVSVTIGFILAQAITWTPLASYNVYADPLMMIAMSIYFIKVPLEMFVGAARKIIMISDHTQARSLPPAKYIQRDIELTP
jgi:predicted Co/Zn/Cd cation transporter (cation efflux family)